MNEQTCKYCSESRKPRQDRPGKFFTMCNEHYAEYKRKKVKESYERHAERRRQDRRDYYWSDPERAREAVRRYQATERGRATKQAYMDTYRRPYRAHVKSYCEACGFIAVDLCQLDVHHIDSNHLNDDPSNLRTLCPPCHRLL